MPIEMPYPSIPCVPRRCCEPGQDVPRFYHAALASEQKARLAGIFGDEEMRLLYLEQAKWRTALALRYLGSPDQSLLDDAEDE